MMSDALSIEARLEAEDEELAAAQAAEIAAKAAAEQTLEVGDEILEGEPPDDIEADTVGLPTQRARLVKFAAWRTEMQTGLDRMEAGRAAYLKAMGAPAETEGKLRALINADVDGVLALILGNRPALTKPQIRSLERTKLEEKLASDKHAREVALAAFDAADRAIDLRQRELEVLDNRHRSFVVAAVREHAEVLSGRYLQQIAALKQTLAELRGLGAVLGGEFDSSYTREVDVKLPAFQIPGVPGYRGETVRPYAPLHPSIRVTEAEADDAAAPWRALATLWTQNPHAEPSPIVPAIDTTDDHVPLPDEQGPEAQTKEGTDAHD